MISLLLVQRTNGPPAGNCGGPMVYVRSVGCQCQCVIGIAHDPNLLMERVVERGAAVYGILGPGRLLGALYLGS